MHPEGFRPEGQHTRQVPSRIPTLKSVSWCQGHPLNICKDRAETPDFHRTEAPDPKAKHTRSTPRGERQGLSSKPLWHEQ